MSILITGGAGFIGSHLSEAYLNKNKSVVVLDNFNNFYDPDIKFKNIQKFSDNKNFTLINGDILDKSLVFQTFENHQIDTIIHLAAMAGVRPSIQQASLYFDVNVMGTLNILDAAKNYSIQKVLLASSSSVYGNNRTYPYKETDNVDCPISPYAASKKAMEVLAYNYHHLYQFPIACLRFFTVYGPRQRPEMAIHKFAANIMNSQEISVFNYGNCFRDYTFINDIIHGIMAIERKIKGYDCINLGNTQTTSTLEMIHQLEINLNKKAKIKLLAAQPGDVDKTHADITKAKIKYNYNPQTSIQQGLKLFTDWYLSTIS